MSAWLEKMIADTGFVTLVAAVLSGTGLLFLLLVVVLLAAQPFSMS